MLLTDHQRYCPYSAGHHYWTLSSARCHILVPLPKQSHCRFSKGPWSTGSHQKEMLLLGCGLWTTLHELQAAVERLQYANGCAKFHGFCWGENHDSRVWHPGRVPSLIWKVGRLDSMISNLQDGLTTLHPMSTKATAVLMAKEPVAGIPRYKTGAWANRSNQQKNATYQSARTSSLIKNLPNKNKF